VVFCMDEVAQDENQFFLSKVLFKFMEVNRKDGFQKSVAEGLCVASTTCFCVEQYDVGYYQAEASKS